MGLSFVSIGGFQRDYKFPGFHHAPQFKKVLWSDPSHLPALSEG
jgi:hypothetical protein